MADDEGMQRFDAVLDKWMESGLKDHMTKDQARRLAGGLMLLASKRMVESIKRGERPPVKPEFSQEDCELAVRLWDEEMARRQGEQSGS